MVFRAPLEALIVPESGSETENGRGCVSALTIILAALAAGVSYLLGSIPSALIAARLAGRPDPRTVGTGNAGSTNVALTVGPAAGVAVFLADLLKGTVCGLAGLAIGGSLVGDLCALAAVRGQIPPRLCGVRGGERAAAAARGSFRS